MLVNYRVYVYCLATSQLAVVEEIAEFPIPLYIEIAPRTARYIVTAELAISASGIGYLVSADTAWYRFCMCIFDCLLVFSIFSSSI